MQNEAVFLRQKGAVLELLLEVASEVAVHKRQHTGTKFPELKDTQLLELLEKFLESYGGYAAERPTTHNYFNLQRYVLLTANAKAAASLQQMHDALRQLTCGTARRWGIVPIYDKLLVTQLFMRMHS